ncbi:anoctamin-6-like [Camelus dromedarius]|uniref:anoctamin-6-like n=1 Tax=Camelus dromedarius TaxID=9838 RepID=UPI003119D1F3
MKFVKLQLQPPSEDLSCPSEQGLLYRECAPPRSIDKKQPLDLIRKFYGEKVGIYFAWAGLLHSDAPPGSSREGDLLSCDPGGCLLELMMQLTIIMGGQSIWKNIQEVLLPWVMNLMVPQFREQNRPPHDGNGTTICIPWANWCYFMNTLI